MTCPVCGGSLKTTNTVGDCETTYRRKQCKECDYIFHTTETELPSSDREYHDAVAEKSYNARHKKLKNT